MKDLKEERRDANADIMMLVVEAMSLRGSDFRMGQLLIGLGLIADDPILWNEESATTLERMRRSPLAQELLELRGLKTERDDKLDRLKKACQDRIDNGQDLVYLVVKRPTHPTSEHILLSGQGSPRSTSICVVQGVKGAYEVTALFDARKVLDWLNKLSS